MTDERRIEPQRTPKLSDERMRWAAREGLRLAKEAALEQLRRRTQKASA
jgi:hypothetical protein